MYGAIRTYRVSDAAELSRRVKEEFVPMVREVPGFVAYYVVDGGDGAVSSVTICEDREGAEASTARAADWIQERTAPLTESGPEVTVGEVTVEHSLVRT
jgi:hypothetical protein